MLPAVIFTIVLTSLAFKYMHRPHFNDVTHTKKRDKNNQQDKIEEWESEFHNIVSYQYINNKFCEYLWQSIHSTIGYFSKYFCVWFFSMIFLQVSWIILWKLPTKIVHLAKKYQNWRNIFNLPRNTWFQFWLMNKLILIFQWHHMQQFFHNFFLLFFPSSKNKNVFKMSWIIL